MTKLRVFVAMLAAIVASVSIWPADAASASTAAKVTVSPSTVVATNQYAQKTHKLIGTGAVVTVKVGPNHVLKPYWPVEVQECDPYPTSLSDCDMLTTLAYDELTKLRVEAAGNGSVTIHFLIWTPLPQTWDPASVVSIGPGHPVALWIGDDPSNWATTGVVSAPVAIKTATSKHVTHHAPKAGGTSGAATGSTRSHGLGVGGIVAVVVVVLAVLSGGAVSFDRRRKRGSARRRRTATT
jgi:hypothetical protein